MSSSGLGVREVGALYVAWKRTDRAGKQRIVDEPRLFLRALASTPSSAAEDESDSLYEALTTLAAIAWRAGRRVRDGGHFTAGPDRAWRAASETFAPLGATLEEMQARGRALHSGTTSKLAIAFSITARCSARNGAGASRKLGYTWPSR